MQHDPMAGGQFSDLGRGHTDHRQGTIVSLGHLGPRAPQHAGQRSGLRRANHYPGPYVGVHEVAHRARRDQFALADDHQIVGRLGHFREQMARNQYGSALRGQIAQEVTHPQDPLGIKAVHRFVEQHGVRIPQERHGNTEPLMHPEGELPDLFVRNRRHADQVEHLIDPSSGDTVRRSQIPQMVASGTTGMHVLRVEQRADFAQRMRQIRVQLAVEPGDAGRGSIEREHAAHRGRLA